MKPRVEGMEVATYADLIRIANLPKAITPAFTAAPLRFWSPAFKVNPALYFRWTRQMTIFQPAGDEGDRLPDRAALPGHPPPPRGRRGDRHHPRLDDHRQAEALSPAFHG